LQKNTNTSLLEVARQLGSLIQAHNDEAERDCRLSSPVLAALHETGLLRMVTPKSLGGLEVDPVTRALVIEEIAGHDTAAGWTLANPLDWAYLSARLPDEGIEEIYGSGGDVLRAAQFGRPITAVRASGGYRISGQGPFVSNCYDANWIAMTAIVTLEDQTQDDDKGEPEVLMVYFPSATLTPEETFDFPKNQVRILHREKVATAAHRLYLRAGDNF